LEERESGCVCDSVFEKGEESLTLVKKKREKKLEDREHKIKVFD
jgi:hypothetical protein